VRGWQTEERALHELELFYRSTTEAGTGEFFVIRQFSA